jgi:cytochrome c5
MLVMLVVVVGGPLSAGTAETQIAERLKKVGEVCLQGQDCASASTGTEIASATGFDVEATYGKSCATCHNMGIAGAPKLGDVDAWSPRLAQGMDVLYDHGINGLAPGMPAKGMCFTCSDDDIKSLVDYMVSSVE